MYRPKMAQVYEYVDLLFESLKKPDLCEIRLVSRMKKFLNFVGLSICPKGEFLHYMRRVRTPHELFSVCDKYMIQNGSAEKVLPL